MVTIMMILDDDSVRLMMTSDTTIVPYDVFIVVYWH